MKPDATPTGGIPPVAHAAAEADEQAPDGSDIRLLLGRGHGATRASVCEARLPAGQVARPIRHQTVEELWYILEGTGEIWRCPPGADDAPALPVGPGDALAIPMGWRFQFRASPTGPLRFLCLTVPPWPGDQEAAPAASGGLGPPTV